MIISRNLLIGSITNYTSLYPEENQLKNQFLELLNHPRCYQRDHLPGHITGSAWIIDRDRKFVLLTHHAKLNKWLQPGGHADGDENIFNVAVREAHEETGLKNIKLLKEGIFDIDIHTIPARKEFPAHLHYDIRFIFEASREEKIILTEESHDLQWKSLIELPMLTDNSSMLRMKEKSAAFML
jgi:8-oxo-dGTP pyrophosphatase MutT (NUDIX family)